MTIQTKNLPFRTAPKPPAYDQPWHDWVKNRIGLPLFGGDRLLVPPGEPIRCVVQQVLHRDVPRRDFRIERIAFARGFEFELVEVDGYRAYLGAAYDLVPDFAHADEPPFRIVDLVPRVMRADPDAWINTRARNCNPVAAAFHAIAYGVLIDPVQLGAAALPEPTTNKGER